VNLTEEWAEDLEFIYLDVTEKLVIDRRTRQWCKLEYPNNKEGCPFYGSRSECPPHAPLIEELLDLNQPHFFAFQKFDLKGQMEKMLKIHPEWSEKKAKCSRYWQKHVKALLREKIYSVTQNNQIFTFLPEAMGVDVFKTAKKLGIILKKRPKTIVYKIALVGHPHFSWQNFDTELQEQILNLKEEYISDYQKYVELGHPEEKAQAHAREPKKEAHLLLLNKGFTEDQAAKIFKSLGAFEPAKRDSNQSRLWGKNPDPQTFLTDFIQGGDKAG